MKTIIVSRPKSGTFLAANLLENFDMEFTNMILRPDSYCDVSAGSGLDSFLPDNQVIFNVRLKDSVHLVPDNGFAVSHLKCTEHKKYVLKDFKKVFVTRDLKERHKSFQRMKNYFLEEGEAWEDKTYEKIDNEMIALWENEPDVFTITFEEMVEKNVEKINNLQTFLFGKVKFDSLNAIEKALQKDSVTKSIQRS